MHLLTSELIHGEMFWSCKGHLHFFCHAFVSTLLSITVEACIVFSYYLETSEKKEKNSEKLHDQVKKRDRKKTKEQNEKAREKNKENYI